MRPTVAPLAAAASAVALPMPRDAPVITTTLPFHCMPCSSVGCDGNASAR